MQNSRNMFCTTTKGVVVRWATPERNLGCLKTFISSLQTASGFAASFASLSRNQDNILFTEMAPTCIHIFGMSLQTLAEQAISRLDVPRAVSSRQGWSVLGIETNARPDPDQLKPKTKTNTKTRARRKEYQTNTKPHT